MAKILLAEDESAVREFVTRGLAASGHEVTAVGDGMAALDALEVDAFDLLLSDIVMPELDGLGATQQIRATRRTATHPWIIALTAGAMQEDRSAAQAAGLNDFLSKPVRIDALAEAMQRAHQQVRATRDSKA